MSTHTPSLPLLPCTCATLRRASRAVSRAYDEALKPTGLRVTQFTLLQFLARSGRTSQGRVGSMLALDHTTLSRTLRPLHEAGWIRFTSGEDRRERLVELTATGRAKLTAALPFWSRIQRSFRRAIGPDELEQLQAQLRAITAMVDTP